MSIPDKNWQPPTVSLDTSMGEIVVELYWKHAPLTCRNFAELARRGYYNNTKFHRIIKVIFKYILIAKARLYLVVIAINL